MTLTDSKRDGSIIDLILGTCILHFLDENTGKFVHGFLPRPSPGLPWDRPLWDDSDLIPRLLETFEF